MRERPEELRQPRIVLRALDVVAAQRDDGTTPGEPRDHRHDVPGGHGAEAVDDRVVVPVEEVPRGALEELQRLGRAAPLADPHEVDGAAPFAVGGAGRQIGREANDVEAIEAGRERLCLARRGDREAAVIGRVPLDDPERVHV